MNLKERDVNIGKFFDDIIERYDKRHLQEINNKNIITTALNSNTVKVLDLGVGTGLELIALFNRFPDVEVVAIDISEKMIQKLKKRDFSHKVKAICGDFFETDFGGVYDAVISSAALHHFNEKDKELLFKKIYNSLKENGQFINSDRFAENQEEQNRLMKEYEENPNSKPHMDTPLTVENEIKILKRVGFKNIQVDLVDNVKYRLIKAEKTTNN